MIYLYTFNLENLTTETNFYFSNCDAQLAVETILQRTIFKQGSCIYLYMHSAMPL